MTTTVVPTRLLTAAQAGELLGVHASTVREMWGAGELRFVDLGRGRKVSDAEIARYIYEHEHFADQGRGAA
ncbi:helix-turn-helix domain-containing protein [Rhodococcus sp. MSC1_016]|jgi:excisionase family DNA binding protein|uniref:helix-turn-helix domain-containing protein n=1 Tax=Rhodococcus sp. MSC1_016 TaxID=2909266 RepID=UPI00203032A1|nr:helix-turn-helix domain-containing protein [Rhodococcus sp. MSC1_016]